jgi:cyclin-dependent kinase regulatory subunit CKS1
MSQVSDDYYYSVPIQDTQFEYRYVILSPSLRNVFPSHCLLTADQLRGWGVQQSEGWVHFALQPRDPLVLLFRKPLTPDKLRKELDRRSAAESMKAVAIANRKLRIAKIREMAANGLLCGKEAQIVS